ncbi:hypothetical protein FACS1894166_02470 [Bacilli bacterium]|nr:hypothetical protein FACS1894166_02470 [Bacilli bacterium]
MLSNKAKKPETSLTKVAQKKIDEIKLESHVLDVKQGKNSNVASSINHQITNLQKAVKNTIAYGKSKGIDKQLKKLLDNLTDCVALFITNLIDEGAAK